MKRLEDKLGWQWFDGAKSFVDQWVKGWDLLPFWVLTWWREMSDTIAAKGRWQKVDD